MFLDILVGYEVKLKFEAIKGVVRGVVIFGVGFGLLKICFFEILTRKVVIVKNVDFAGV